MSSPFYDPSAQPAKPSVDPSIYEPLTEKERELLHKLLGNPREFPAQMKEWMVDYTALNLPNLPITQFIGYQRFVANVDTTFPDNPVSGQPFVLQVDAANGINWALRYDANIADSYKWTFEGGAPLHHTIATEQSTASTSYADLSTVGPTVTVPKAGVYRVDYGASLINNTAESDVVVGVKYSAGTPTDTESIQAEGIVSGGGANRTAQSRSIVVTVTSDSQIVKLQYKVGSSTGVYRNRWIIVTPIRLAG